MNVVIIDYGMGNLRSVANAFEALGCAAKIADHPDALRSSDRIVLPGVGAFGDGIRNLREGGWVEALEEEVRSRGKPFLGLCLGMQLLAGIGTENGRHEGLNWIPGIVTRLQSEDPAVRIPHIGWNDVRLAKRDGLYRGLSDPQVFYFVHSYVLRPEDASVVSGWCSHSEEFPASLETGSIYATQYHPEKSQRAGLSVLTNFLSLKA